MINAIGGPNNTQVTQVSNNILGALILFQCRTNTLRLKWRQGFAGGAMDCPLCGAEEETVAP